jgi:hypothetical protein
MSFSVLAIWRLFRRRINQWPRSFRPVLGAPVAAEAPLPVVQLDDAIGDALEKIDQPQR